MTRTIDKKPAGATPKSGADEPRKKVTLYLPPSQWRALKVQAAQSDREMSEIVSDALKEVGID